MAELETKQKTEVEDSNSLRGTLLSVGILGLILVGVWVAIFNLFVIR